MPEVVSVEFEANTDKAEANLNDVVDALKDINSKLGENKKAIEKNAESTKELESNFKKVAKGVRGFGLALKAAGIGLAVEAFQLFKEVVGQNQTVIDAFNTGMEALTTAFNDLFNFISNNIGTVTGFFKDIFENPKENLIAFGDAIKNNLIERFNSFLDTLGFLATAVKKVFERDFTGALEAVKQAGKESVDVLTGVDNSVDKVGKAVSNASDAIVNYTKSTFEAAAATVQLQKDSEVAIVQNRILLEQYDRQAEKLRQVRDDDMRSMEERIAANEELGRVLDEQEKLMIANADLVIKNAQAQYDANQNQENYIALLEAQAERDAVLAQIEGFRSEQLVNRNSLLREQQQLVQEGIDAEQKALEERKKQEQEFTQYVKQQEEARKKAKEELTVSGLNSILALNSIFEGKTVQEQKKAFERTKKLNIAATTVETYLAAQKAYSSQIIPLDPTSVVRGVLAASAAVAAGLARVAQIRKQKFTGGGGGGATPISIGGNTGGGVGGGTGFNPATQTISAIPQFTNTATGNNQTGVRAYVIENDITNQQALAKRLDQRATL